MAINLTKLINSIQSRLGGVTPSTPVKELELLAKAAFISGDDTIRALDSDALFLDSATTSAPDFRMIYNRASNNIFMWDSDNSWKPISGTAPPSSTQAQGSTSGYSSGG